MKVSVKWLKQYVDLDGISSEEIAHRLTFAGIEVEEILPLAQATGLVIGQILSCEKHPDSDHLHVLEVDLGSKYGHQQIVCGAPNARTGLKVIVARVGAKLPAVTIADSTIRGVASHGMCCSLSELGVDKKYLTDAQLAGIEELPLDAPVGEEDVLAYLGLDDTILDLSLLANRSDCNALWNVAKEVGALFERKVTLPEAEISSSLCENPLQVGSETDHCPQFNGVIMEGIQIGDSPRWLKQRLMAMGVRSINNLVDIGNYIMLLTGQPLHMYDLDRLPKAELIVRDDYEGEFVALDDKTYLLQKGDLVVTSNHKVMCLAGVMGSKECAIDDSTKRIVIESAYFAGASVRRTSTRLNLISESSARFVKGIHPHQAEKVLHLTTQMIRELCHAQKESKIVTYDTMNHEPKVIFLKHDFINHRLGTAFSDTEIEQVLSRVGISLTKVEGGYQAFIPEHRIDMNCDADLSEEVIRILGFDHVKSELPTLQASAGGLTTEQEKKRKIRRFLLDQGLDEIVTYTLVSKEENRTFRSFSQEDAYRLLHPMTDDRAQVRQSLIPSMLKTIQYNVARQAHHLALFEMSDMYSPSHHGLHLCVAFYGADPYHHQLKTIPYDFYTAKGLIESIMEMLAIEPTRYHFERIEHEQEEFHPGRSAYLFLGKEKVGVFGELHPYVAKKYDLGKLPCYVLELRFDALLQVKTSRKKMQAPAKFPFVERDLAFIVKSEIPVQDIIKTIMHTSKDVVKDAVVFDVYQGEHIDFGYKSVAIKVTYQSLEKTLEEKDILVAENKIKEALYKNHHIVLRG